MIVRARVERWPLREAFTIARGSKREAVVVVVELEDAQGVVGRGEALPYARYGEDPASVVARIEAIDARDLTRERLCALLPAGAARNALDLALWDLEAKRSGVRAWRAAGLDEPRPLTTAWTIPICDVERTRALAERAADRALLKVKLGAKDDAARARAVREAAPNARIVVDANEGWSPDELERIAPVLAELGVEVIEQPLPASSDAALARVECPVPLCADESFHGEPSELERLVDRYDAVNVKLDKQGGLTTALRAIERARELGLDVMVGTMVATSLGVAPAVLLAQRARWADVDAAAFLARDRAHALRYEGSLVHPPNPALWG
ncbi:MAG TPA: N-acetyl-D-Glu racemase DgcA [Sandaracinaceae bacterium]